MVQELLHPLSRPRLVVVFTAGLGLAAGHITTHPGYHTAERSPPVPPRNPTPPAPCSPVELVGLGIDRGLPLGATRQRARRNLGTASGWGPIFTVILWGLQAFPWGLATLAIATYIDLVLKPT